MVIILNIRTNINTTSIICCSDKPNLTLTLSDSSDDGLSKGL